MKGSRQDKTNGLGWAEPAQAKPIQSRTCSAARSTVASSTRLANRSTRVSSKLGVPGRPLFSVTAHFLEGWSPCHFLPEFKQRLKSIVVPGAQFAQHLRGMGAKTRGNLGGCPRIG
jgi:hypothetical protein